MIIRDAVEADLPTIVEIYNATVPTRMVTAELEQTNVEARLPWFREHSPERYPFWVMASDGRVIGWLDFKKFLSRGAYRGTAEISVYVDENFRGRGVGQRLLQHAIAHASSLGITALVGLIFGHNERSLKLFERLGFERWAFLPGVAQLDGVQRDLVMMGQHCPAHYSHGTVGRPVSVERASNVDAPQARGYNDTLGLMHTLMQYRHEPIHSQLLKIRDKYSMLHLDVLILIYHFARVCSGHILEIGAFIGGATIAAAFGVRDSGGNKKLIAIEPGGSVKHKRLGTRNILRDLERNLARQRVSKMVSLIKGRSFDAATIRAAHGTLGPDKIGLLILDADAAKRRDIECYRNTFATDRRIGTDTYYGPYSTSRTVPEPAHLAAF